MIHFLVLNSLFRSREFPSFFPKIHLLFISYFPFIEFEGRALSLSNISFPFTILFTLFVLHRSTCLVHEPTAFLCAEIK
jgi:hypothetical protein